MKTTGIVRILAYTVVLGLVVLTVVPAAERPESGLQHDLEHFLAFAFGGALFALAYPGQRALLALGPVLYTLALELVQIPLPTRHARVVDFIVDALGAYAGIGAVALIDFYRTKAAET